MDTKNKTIVLKFGGSSVADNIKLNIVAEKIIKRFQLKQAPNSKILKAGLNNLKFHMEYIDYLADRNNYLAGKNLTLADLTVAAHLSIIDYLGDIPWNDYKNAKLWYAKIKSRPSFKDILKDNHYDKMTVKIFHDYTAFLSRAEGMNNMAAVEQKESLRREKKIRKIILNISM